VTASYTDKLVLGRAIGAAWTNGPPGKTIGLCEGFETAAAYTSLTGIQAWATMGAKRFHQVEHPASVERVILLADNDPKAAAREASARGLPVPASPSTPNGHRAHERLGAAPEAVRGGGLQGRAVVGSRPQEFSRRPP
jgi:hypothetical protein